MRTENGDEDERLAGVVHQRDDDEHERVVDAESDGESHIPGRWGRARGAVDGREAPDQSQVVAGRVQEGAFSDVRPAAQQGAAHAAAIEDQGELRSQSSARSRSAASAIPGNRRVRLFSTAAERRFRALRASALPALNGSAVA